MINLILELFIYQKTIISTSPTYFNAISNMTYGFKRNSKVFVNISELSTPIIFGLGTKQEIKELKRKNTCYQYCQGTEKISEIQYFIKENTSINFTIPTKSVLTPFSISCDEIYIYSLSINIHNGNNHLDYRYQDIIIIEIVFSVLFFMETIIFSIFLNFFSKTYCCGNLFAFLIMLSVPHAAQSLMQIVYFLKNKNNEMLSKNDFFSAEFICYFFYLIFLCFEHSFSMFIITIWNQRGTIVFSLYTRIISIFSFLASLMMGSFSMFLIDENSFKLTKYLIWLILLTISIFLILYIPNSIFLRISLALNLIVSFFSFIIKYFCFYSETSILEQGKTLIIVCILTRIIYIFADALAIYKLNFICGNNKKIENDDSDGELDDYY